MKNWFTNISSRYQLIQELGRGGMGVVYLAKDLALDRSVAIKLVKASSEDFTLTEQLKAEAKLLAKLNNANVVQLYDVVQSDSNLALILEYVDGNSLFERTKEAPFDKRLRIWWLIQIADGLAKAHEAGIAHCDLKLQNILVAQNGDVKIADFGIARAKINSSIRGADLSSRHKVIGSVHSLSPEQACGKEVGIHTDLFSLGILIHQVLTGDHPFGELKDRNQMIDRIVNQKYQAIKNTQGLMTPELSEMTATLLAKKPIDRTLSANNIASLLRKELLLPDARNHNSQNTTIKLDSIKPKHRRNRIVNTLLALLVVCVALLAYRALSVHSEKGTIYVSIIKPRVISDLNLSQEHIRQIRSTIEIGLQQSLLSLQSVNLVPSFEIEKFDGNVVAMARAIGADFVIMPEADCGPEQCQIQLKKLRGENGTVAKYRNWPVLAESLTDIRTTTISQTDQLFDNNGDDATPTISEVEYRKYLEVSSLSMAGTNAAAIHLDQLERIQTEAPNFISAYALFLKAAVHLYSRTGNKNYLDRTEKLLARAPYKVATTRRFKQLKFELFLQFDRTDQALKLLQEISEKSSDRVLINELEGSLAYKNGDHQKSLDLDKENSILQPSTQRFYNLATSEFLRGDYESANSSLENALQLYPDHIYSHNLKAAIALMQGDLDDAIHAYKKIIATTPDSESLSNLGLALSLRGEHEEAIQHHLKAVALHRGNPVYQLNLADSYDLANQKSAAENHYDLVLEMSAKQLSAQSYSIRAQAYAHLGKHNSALKTLRTGKTKFPDSNELSYAGALVYALSGNQQAAIVEIEASIESGTSPIWFQYSWFDALCDYHAFRTLTELEPGERCSPDAT